MTDPDLTDITSDSGSSQDTSTESSDRTSASQIYLKGRWGTKTVRNTKGCIECRKNADYVILTGYRESSRGSVWRSEILACDDHLTDAKSKANEQRGAVEVREF